MALSSAAIKELLEQFVKDSAPVHLRNRMQKAVPSIVQKMEKKGLRPDTTSLEVLVRDALFRLWKTVIPSGTIADMIRDSQDDRVVEIVTDDLVEGEDKNDLTTIVESTMEALLDVTL
jgi:hypothetical protein